MIGFLDFRARGQHVITIDSCYNEAHDDLTFNVIGTTMAYYNLTFNVIGATLANPSPLLAYINQEFVAIKRNCLDGTPVTSDCLSLTEGLGWQTAGSLFLRTPQLCWGKFHCLSLSAEYPLQHSRMSGSR